MQVLVGKDGNVQDVRVVSGIPQLASAAKAAVCQWRYRPMLQEGEPVEVLTTVTVNFRLTPTK